jgi:hypothetical protein
MVMLRIRHADAQAFMARFGRPMLIFWIVAAVLYVWMSHNILLALFMSAFITAVVFGLICMVFLATRR